MLHCCKNRAKWTISNYLCYLPFMCVYSHRHKKSFLRNMVHLLNYFIRLNAGGTTILLLNPLSSCIYFIPTSGRISLSHPTIPMKCPHILLLSIGDEQHTYLIFVACSNLGLNTKPHHSCMCVRVCSFFFSISTVFLEKRVFVFNFQLSFIDTYVLIKIHTYSVLLI